MLWLQITVQWLHVFLGIFWFGSVLFLNFVLIPSLSKLPFDQQATLNKQITPQANRLIMPAAALVILFGILRGTLSGPVKSLDFLLGTQYGLTFLVSLVLSIGVYAWGYFLTRPTAERLLEEGARLVDGKATAFFTSLSRRIRVIVLLELLGFLAVFTCMILMAFGL